MSKEILIAAKEYTAKGFVIHPLSSPHDVKTSPGKRPLLNDWDNRTKATDEDLIKWFENKDNNIGLVCGKTSGVTVLDFDNMLFFDDVFKGVNINTLSSGRTTGRGHVYFKYIEALRAQKHHDLGIEVLSDGNNAVLPPSIHQSGDVYKWSNPDAPIIIMPDIVFNNIMALFQIETELKQFLSKCRHCFRDVIKRNPDMHDAEGREYMLAICTDLKSAGATETHIKMFAKLMYGKDYNESRTITEWGNIDASKTWTCEKLKQKLPAYIDLKQCERCQERKERYTKNKDAGNSNNEQRSKYLVTDIANAYRFVEMYKDNVVFVSEWQKWHAWNDKIWDEQPNERMYEHAHKTVMEMYKLIPEITNDNERMSFAKNVPKCEDTYKIKGMLEQSKPYLLEKADNFDKYPMCFVVNNGVINLETLQFEPHDRNRKVTKMSNVVYNPAAKCPKWEDDLNKAFKGNKETIKFFQKAAGYSMTGMTGEQCFFILWGDGANLKTTLMEVVCAVLGDYHKDMDIKTIQERQKNSNSPSPELAILAGSRLVKCGENKEEFRLSEGLVKQITGSDGKISCRRLHENDSSFIPEFKLFIYTNHKPQIKGTDYGIWRRVKLIPFTYKVPDNEKIPDYHKIIIKDELSGVLNWMLEGVKLWKHEGIGTCPDVEEATTKFREENDTILQFINEFCDVVKNGTAKSQDLYTTYVQDFCVPMGEPYLTQREFKNKLVDKGFEHKKSMHGHYYQGLKLKNNTESLDNDTNMTPNDTKKHNFPIENTNRKIHDSGVITCHNEAVDSETHNTVTELPQNEHIGIIRSKILELKSTFNAGVPGHVLFKALEDSGADMERVRDTVKRLVPTGQIMLSVDSKGSQVYHWAGA